VLPLIWFFPRVSRGFVMLWFDRFRSFSC
jgi:hypothetical protein